MRLRLAALVEQVIGVGIGLSFRAGDRARVFLEARYHHVFGDEFEGRAANGQYVPITLAVEF